ncbi:transcription repressor NadR [Streptococcus didelphis]|uniref:Transcription repressor NadR n=1 Tax=Streptococcus didelphis TaxID=102886 RepID=A0ABY9LGX6_9STRE|nr:transcription repressor NadR [Streptococcus didelphis]WMB28075.1 transcription repressor NadR [Streptococcus didelphis]WMB29986.1 transcription repressor NadR [Streptococcus didelphis]
MKAQERREKILTILEKSNETLSASYLAAKLGVSRQVIVGDIALLRASQKDIISTPRGYLMKESLYSSNYTARIVCQHGLLETKEELSIIIDRGGIVSTVEVEHPIYGMLTASLNIKSSEDIHNFLEKVNDSKAELLSSLTEGVHSHLISCSTKEDFEAIKLALEEAGLLYIQK